MPETHLREIVLFRTDRIGDVILSLPVATALKEAIPDCRITFVVRRYTQPVVELSPHVDRIVSIESFTTESGRLRFMDFISNLRTARFQAAIHLFPRPAQAAATFLGGIPLRLGSGYRWYSVLFNRRIYEHRKTAEHHEVEYNLHLLRLIGIDVAQPEFALQETGAARESIFRLLAELGVQPEQPLVLLHPGSGGSAREWPLASFSALAGKLITDVGAQVLITGNAAEQPLARRIVQENGMKPHSLAGRLTLQELFSLQRRADIFVSNSTGPLHLAVAAGTEVVAFYPPIRPCRCERWGPYGRRSDVLMSQETECTRCLHLRQGEACACMAAISVQQAYTKVRQKIEARRRSARYKAGNPNAFSG